MTRTFVCPKCGHEQSGLITAAGHPCPANHHKWVPYVEKKPE